MTEEQKNEEGQNFSEDFEGKLEDSHQPSTLEDKKTIKEWGNEESKNKKIQNLWAALVIVCGLFVGSLFVDISQFVNKGGYSERALQGVELFQSGERTWVAHKGAPVEVTVLVPDEEGLEDCPDCDPTEVIKWLKQNFPTLIAKKTVVGTQEGDAIIAKYELKTIPSFVFDENVVETEFYENPQVQAIFNEQDGKFVLNSVALGIPVGKYLEMPEIDEEDTVLGNPDAKTKMIVFSDFQCPYSKMFFDTAMEVMKDYKDNVAFVYKDLPLSFHPQAQNAAMASRCAQDQDKFWEMSEVLYADQGIEGKSSTWDNQEGIKVFSTYASKIGLNISEFNNCMEEKTHLTKIKNDEALAGNFGISGTPSGFVGDEFIGGVVQDEQLRELIDEQISKNQ